MGWRVEKTEHYTPVTQSEKHACPRRALVPGADVTSMRIDQRKGSSEHLTDLRGITAYRIFWDAIRSISRLLMGYIMEGPNIRKGKAHGDWKKKKHKKTEGKK